MRHHLSSFLSLFWIQDQCLELWLFAMIHSLSSVCGWHSTASMRAKVSLHTGANTKTEWTELSVFTMEGMECEKDLNNSRSFSKMYQNNCGKPARDCHASMSMPIVMTYSTYCSKMSVKQLSSCIITLQATMREYAYPTVSDSTESDTWIFKCAENPI